MFAEKSVNCYYNKIKNINKFQGSPALPRKLFIEIVLKTQNDHCSSFEVMMGTDVESVSCGEMLFSFEI